MGPIVENAAPRNYRTKWLGPQRVDDSSPTGTEAALVMSEGLPSPLCSYVFFVVEIPRGHGTQRLTRFM